MPIKLPKGFQRRKSSGNALDEVRNPPDSHSSFRVLERPGSKEKSFDGGLSMRMASGGAPRPPPKDHDDHEEDDIFVGARQDVSNRGSGGTERSHSTAPYDSGASSTRLSISSTNPSSVDTRSDKDKNLHTSTQRSPNDVPVPPPSAAKPAFLRSPGRTFSFGIVRGSRGSPTGSPGAHVVIDNNRSRAVTTSTASTASTATPPRLFDSDLALENSELDGFGNMFDHIGSSPGSAPVRPIQEEEPMSSPSTSYPPTSYPGAAAVRSSRTPVPSPIRTDGAQGVESSPYSWNSHDSQDGLMRSPSPSKTITQGGPARERENSLHRSRHSPLSSRSVLPSRKPVGQRAPAQEEDERPVALMQSRSRDSNLMSTSPIREATEALSPSSTHSATFDPAIAADAQLANMYQETKVPPPKPVSSNKVMTPAQWEQYKQQKEMDRRLGALSDDSDSNVSDDYEDDDEIERDRRATKQRQKQEAHLAVYRQQMMKVTGEKLSSGTESSLGTMKLGNGSSNDLNNQLSHLSMDLKQPGRSSGEDEDEDEDVPLGILAAHGFPNKNRPPTQLSKLPSNPNLRVVSQSQAASSVVSQAPKGPNLPVFARHLPQDPYYGAGLVSSSIRESLSIHPASPALGAGPSTAHPVHPAGLVGVIAGEERARAARRGSPNASGTYDMPAPPPGMLPRSQIAGNLSTMGYPMGMPGMPGMPPMVSPGEQAQIQMSQQMNQMMHMQMQWMQQMQQMMGGQGQPPPGMPPQPGQQRPQSVHMQQSSGPQLASRTMSALHSGMAPWNSSPSFVPAININGGYYTPSIAPSERSNVGLAPRYRPVSIVGEPDASSTRRSSTFTTSTYRPWSQGDNVPRASMHGAKPSVNTLGRRSPLAKQDDDDEEQGWAEMKLQKEKKQKNRALRKGQNPLQELYTNAP
ncbi:hypothetical protein A1O1_08915 [Capronia coronata CBS 617.96]|uniref:Uncharacterized protein n=1 Tax=Capronia coronata CBS 617.96 TaxID=1182541 RepID=W9Y7Y8_9EURO|nr:uncharacterized protein A1O1_08915 [Capronia coronata CBS 617.96]EXJ78514.1 hypothetical protein A1O1_08915 [Capronia coronata CBS 617.96]